MTYCGYSSLLHITNNTNNTTEPPTQPAQWDGCTSTSPDCRMWEPVWSEVNTNNQGCALQITLQRVKLLLASVFMPSLAQNLRRKTATGTRGVALACVAARCSVLVFLYQSPDLTLGAADLAATCLLASHSAQCPSILLSSPPPTLSRGFHSARRRPLLGPSVQLAMVQAPVYHSVFLLSYKHI